MYVQARLPSQRILEIFCLSPHRVEIIEFDSTGRWGRLLWQEANGWVSMRYLKAANATRLANTALVPGIRCFGTEPFWQLVIENDKQLKVALTANTYRHLPINTIRSSMNAVAFPIAVVAETDNARASVLIRPGQCSDGMSDRQYGWLADVLSLNTQQTVLLSGCCHNSSQSE